MSFEDYEENILKKETEEIIIYKFFCNYLERPFTYESKKRLIDDLNRAFFDYKKRRGTPQGDSHE